MFSFINGSTEILKRLGLRYQRYEAIITVTSFGHSHTYQLSCKSTNRVDAERQFNEMVKKRISTEIKSIEPIEKRYKI